MALKLQFSYSLIAFFLFLVFLIRLVWDRKIATNKKLPPGPWKLPVIGNAHHFIGRSMSQPHYALADLAKKYGPLMHLQLGQMSLVVVSSAKMAKEMMKGNDLAIAQRPEPYIAKILPNVGRDIAFVPYGDYWKQIRRLCKLELLSNTRVQLLSFIREDEASKLIESIRSLSSSGSLVNLTEKISWYTSSVVSRAAFGSNCKDQAKFIKLSEEMLTAAGGLGVLAEMFPALGFIHVLSGKKGKLRKIHAEGDKIMDHIIDEHMKKLESRETYDIAYSTEKEVLLDVLLRLQKNGDLEVPITLEDIKAIIWGVFAGGTDTSSTVVIWAMSELMRHPKVMEKAQKEVREMVKGKKTITETDVQDLVYLRAVIKETLRVRIPGPLLLPRECREQCEVDGYQIPVKTKIIFNAWMITRDPDAWENAESFVPERFISNPIDFKGSDFDFIPFGSGRRICPGMTFGIANVELPLAQLLYYFDWKLPNGMKPEELDMTPHLGHVVVGRKHDLYLAATPYVP